MDTNKIPSTTLTINYCDYSDYLDSPREWECNLGTYIRVNNNYISPDTNKDFEKAIKETADQANNVEHHMKLIKKHIEDYTYEKVSFIIPISVYIHGGQSFSVGSRNGWDTSNDGFYIVTHNDLKRLGLSKWMQKDKMVETIKQELYFYEKWANGEVYSFILEDENENIIEVCSGFYDIDEIKEYLPEEYQNKDLYQYLTY